MIRKYPNVVLVLHLGCVVALSACIPLAFGIWADQRFETAPWLTLAGMLVGVMASTVGIWRTVQYRYTKLERQHGRRDDQTEADT